MAPFATADDVAAIWRPLTDAEIDKTDVLLNVASVILRDRFVDIDDRVTLGTLNPALPGHVVAMMVKRYMQARGADDPTQERIGEAQRTWTPTVGEVELYLTDGDINLLTPVGTRPRVRTHNLGVGLPLP